MKILDYIADTDTLIVQFDGEDTMRAFQPHVIHSDRREVLKALLEMSAPDQAVPITGDEFAFS